MVASLGAIGSLGWTLTGGTLVRSTTGANHVGAVALGTSAVAGTLAALTTLDQAGGNFLCQETFDGAFVFRSDSVDTDTLIRVGFASAHNLDPATDGCWIEKLYADAAWYAVCRSAGVQTRVQMGSTALAAAAAIGAVNIKVNSVVTGIREGSLIWIGGENHTVTVVGDAGATGSGITFTPALTAAHSVGETVARLCQTNEWVSVRIRRVNNEAIGFTLMEYGTGNNNSRGQVNGNDSVRITTNIPSLVELQSGFWVKNQAAAVKLIRPDYFSLHIKGLRR